MNIIFTNKTRAAWILQQLKDFIKLYGAATVKDLHQLYGVTWTIKDNLSGWVDLDSASIREETYDIHATEYILALPKPIPLSGVV